MSKKGYSVDNYSVEKMKDVHLFDFNRDDKWDTYRYRLVVEADGRISIYDDRSEKELKLTNVSITQQNDLMVMLEWVRSHA